MAWNGTGTFLLNPAFSPEANGNLVDAVRYNGLTLDIAAGITAALAKNGENTPTADLPMGGYRHTGVADAVGAGQYLAWDQVPLATDFLDTGDTLGAALVGWAYSLGYPANTVGEALTALTDSVQNVYGTADQITITDDGLGNLTWSLPANLIFPGGVTEPGRLTAYAPASGDVREQVEAETAAASTAMASGVVANVTTLFLPPGNWEVEGSLYLDGNATFAANFFGGGISSNAVATLPAQKYRTVLWGLATAIGVTGSAADMALPLPRQRFASPNPGGMNVYLAAQVSISAGSVTAGGWLRATRYA